MKTEANSNRPVLIVARYYNKKELCALLGDITMYFLNRMLEGIPEMGEPIGTCYSPKQISMLVNRYGFAPVFMENQKKLHK